MDAAEDDSGWGQVFPGWLEARLISDARFARAYDSQGDSGRGQLKRLIAAHYSLNPPSASLVSTRLDVLRGGLTVATDATPRAYAVILCDGGLDAPAFLLPALVPALCSGVPEVLVVRLGAAGGFSAATLAACELAGQERVAALGAAQMERLLAHLAGSGQHGVIIHADTPAVRRLLSRPGLAVLLDCPHVRRVPLPMPARVGLWQDSQDDFPAEAVAQLYGSLPFDQGGPEGARDGQAFEAFAAEPRDLLLAPDGRMNLLFQLAEQGARVTVTRSQLGLWVWYRLPAKAFLRRSTVFSSER